MPGRDHCRCALILFVLAVFAAPVGGQTGQSPADGALLYEKRVKPILEARCYGCHGTDGANLKSEFSLASRVGILRGGAHGPAIDVGDPAQSLLLRAISYTEAPPLRMPPDGKLSEEEIDVINAWVELGAPFGGDDDELTEVAAIEHEFELTEEDRAWWSLQPLERPAPPTVRDTSWPLNEIDRFILARLEEAGLRPAVPAEKAEFIRRATYDLTGLPPTIEEVEAFVNDDSPDAWEQLIERLLSSPQYGVKWGRHWLDLVRFAETDSYERDRLKPGAWRYRDWVIDALNADLPYDEFLLHQLAGDEIEQVTTDSIIATGYLRLGIWDDEPTDTALAQYDDLDSILDTTSRVMLGVSMGCARCHDHKGDPIPQRDYYRMLSFFRGIAPYKVGGGNAPTPANYVDRIPADLGEPGFDDEIIEWRRQRAERLEELQEIVAWVRESAEPEAVKEAAAVRSEGLVAHLPFEDESVTNARDVASDFDGRIHDVINGVEGIHGRCFSFDGEDDYVRIDRPVTDDFTISLWFRTTEVAPGGDDLRWFLGAGLVDGEIRGVVRDFGISLIGEGHVAAGTGRPERFVSSGEGFNDGAWHHVAFTRDMTEGRLALYVDGELVDRSRRASRRPLDEPDSLDIGRMRPGYGYFKGEIDEVRFYDRVLDQREVFDLFLGSGTPYSFEQIVQTVAPERAAEYDEALEQLLALERPERDLIRVLRVKEVDSPPQTHVLIRGNPHAPAEPVSPGFPIILDEREPDLPEPQPEWETSRRRLTLAKWIIDPENLRTARVMANRLWQYHFGRGLVRTPNEFGAFGEPPTHPELLDWLAAEFIDRGWSMKELHRLIMTSSAYRMSSQGSETALALDPQNDLFWRFDMRRLTAEEIRDSILAANGTLNLEMGGPGVYPPMPQEVLATSSRPGEAWGDSPPDQAARRSVYIHLKRSLLNPLLETFDLADTDATCPVRFVTTQPTQALTMLNSEFLNTQAALLAERVIGESGDEPANQIARVIELVTNRRATAAEIREGHEFIKSLKSDDEYDHQQAMQLFCLLALNLNEFVYLD